MIRPRRLQRPVIRLTLPPMSANRRLRRPVSTLRRAAQHAPFAPAHKRLLRMRHPAVRSHGKRARRADAQQRTPPMCRRLPPQRQPIRPIRLAPMQAMRATRLLEAPRLKRGARRRHDDASIIVDATPTGKRLCWARRSRTVRANRQRLMQADRPALNAPSLIRRHRLHKRHKHSAPTPGSKGSRDNMARTATPLGRETLVGNVLAFPTIQEQGRARMFHVRVVSPTNRRRANQEGNPTSRTRGARAGEETSRTNRISKSLGMRRVATRRTHPMGLAIHLRQGRPMRRIPRMGRETLASMRRTHPMALAIRLRNKTAARGILRIMGRGTASSGASPASRRPIPMGDATSATPMAHSGKRLITSRPEQIATRVDVAMGRTILSSRGVGIPTSATVQRGLRRMATSAINGTCRRAARRHSADERNARDRPPCHPPVRSIPTCHPHSLCPALMGVTPILPRPHRRGSPPPTRAQPPLR